MGGAGEQLNSGHFRGGAGQSILENFQGQGAPGQPFPLGSVQGGAGRASLLPTTHPSQSSLIFLPQLVDGPRCDNWYRESKKPRSACANSADRQVGGQKCSL